MPYKVQADEEDAQLALRFIDGAEGVTIEHPARRRRHGAGHEEATGAPLTDFAKGNVKARTRMVAQYAMAGERGLLVVGTDHAAEALTGFFTKYGDGGVDLTPLTGLSKRQGKALLRHLGAPARLYEKAPTADLLDDDPRTDRRGEPRPHLRRHRRLPRGPRRRRRGRRDDRGALPRDRAQAAGARHAARHLVAPAGLSPRPWRTGPEARGAPPYTIRGHRDQISPLRNSGCSGVVVS